MQHVLPQVAGAIGRRHSPYKPATAHLNEQLVMTRSPVHTAVPGQQRAEKGLLLVKHLL